MISIHPGAEIEWTEAIDYYEAQESGLGQRLDSEIRAVIRLIADHPEAGRLLEKGVRRCLARRFKYGVIYTRRLDGLLILAVMNLNREPGYWRRRLA